MKITPTDDLSNAFKEKDDKYRVWATSERPEKVMKAVMVPLIISRDGAVHRACVRWWMDLAPDINVDWVRMARSVLRYNVVIAVESSEREFSV